MDAHDFSTRIKLGCDETSHEILRNENQHCEEERLHSVFGTTGTYEGLLTTRSSVVSVPRCSMTRHLKMRVDDSKMHPCFNGIPKWLRPYLYQLNQMGCREDGLCSIFQDLPSDLLSVLRIACTAVVISAVQRLENSNAKVDHHLVNDDKTEDESWLSDSMGLSDDEMETFAHADFGVLR